jgi:hypothetical protein
MTDSFSHTYEDCTESIGESGKEKTALGRPTHSVISMQVITESVGGVKGVRKSAAQRLLGLYLTDSFGGTTSA